MSCDEFHHLVLTYLRQKEALAHSSTGGIDKEKLGKAAQLFARLVVGDPIRAKYWESREAECRAVS